MVCLCLILFCNPVPDEMVLTTQPQEFRDFVEGLVAFGGGDCREHLLTALLKAIDNSCPKSTIYVFSDASPKDVDLLGDVLSRLQQKQQHVSYAQLCLWLAVHLG